MPLRVRDKFETFGVFLLNDENGDKMAVMREKFRGDPEKITMEVLREWLAGKGVEVSWDSLIATLKKSKLPLMAQQIQMALDQLTAASSTTSKEYFVTNICIMLGEVVC